MASAQVCPVVGTTNTVLPPTHPKFDMDKPGQVCPVTNATTDHHLNLQQHPSVPMDTKNAEECPALQKIVSRPEQQAMDEAVCPVVGSVSTILPPNHPSIQELEKDGKDVCPVTNATLDHHKETVHEHPSLSQAPSGAVCPVVHKTAAQASA